MGTHRTWMVCVLIACSLAGGCHTQYQQYDESGRPSIENDETRFDERLVHYKVERALHANPPACIVVLSGGDTTAERPAAHAMARSLARRLSGRVPRVIGPLQRTRLERRHALDLNSAEDRRRLVGLERCNAFLAWRMIEPSNDYFIVWTRRRVGLEVKLYREPGGTVLWRAEHVASRSDGALPLSLLSLPVAVFEATAFGHDADVLPSMIDDVVRRIVVTLPDMR